MFLAMWLVLSRSCGVLRAWSIPQSPIVRRPMISLCRVVSKPVILPLILWAISVLAISTAGICYLGGDTATEFAHILRVIENGWDIHVWGNNNVSIVTSVLAPWLVETFHTTPTVIYSTVFVAIFALTPVLLYFLFRKLFTPLQSYFSALFFALLPPTYQEVPSRGKSMIAEPLMVALFLVLLSNMRARYKIPVLTLLTVLVIACHYTVGILLLCWLAVAFLVSDRKMQLVAPLAIGAVFSLAYFSYIGGGTILYGLQHWGDIPVHTGDVVTSAILGSPSGVTIPLSGFASNSAVTGSGLAIPSWLQPLAIYLSLAWMLYGSYFVLLRKGIVSSPYFEIFACAGVSGLWCLMALAYPFMTKGLYVSAWIQIGAIFLSLLFGVGVTSKKVMWAPLALLLFNFIVLR